MEHFYHTIGEDWFTYPNLYKGVVEKFNNAIFVEVGSWKGRSASFLGVEIFNSKKNIKVFCVDTWLGSDEHKNADILKDDGLYNEFINNTKSLSSIITPLRMTSELASKEFADESLDFCFLDASHEYNDVLNDLNSWYPKVKPGGIFAGHDYHEHGMWWPGVLEAVTHWNSKHNLAIKSSESCFIIKK